MKKKLLALFAACSMITTAAAGLVQTAYAADPNVRIEYTDGDTDTQKILNFYYEGVDALTAFGGTYSFSSNDVTVDSGSVTLTYNLGIKEFDTENCYISFSTFDDGGSSSADGLFATATITVPSDVDVTVELEVDSFTDAEEDDYEDEIGTVSVVIPKKSAPIPAITPAAVTAVEKQNTEISGTGEFETQTADIYGVQITANDEAVSGAKIYFDDDHQNTITFNTVCSGGGTVEFAVILANVTGVTLPSLSDATITPISATIE